MTKRYDKSGFTLIELMVVLTVTSVFLLLAISWISETMNFSSRMKTHQRQHSQLTRLGWNLRTDVRMSQSMTIEDDTRLVLIRRNGQRVVYTISGATLEVEKSTGSQTHRDRFPLASNSRARWDTSGMPESIGLIVSRSGNPVTGSTKNQDDAINRETATAVDPETLPIDVHIFVRINRWPVEYASDNMNRGGP